MSNLAFVEYLWGAACLCLSVCGGGGISLYNQRKKGEKGGGEEG